MILEALVDQLVQRFQHEKRAQVCLWFDERGEFARVLPLLERHVAGPVAPFVLLAYDADARRGQIWLKHQIHRRLEAASPDERAALRFVLYVPLPEDRLDAAARDDEASLELLAEYRHAGVLFRVAGKRPTLFNVLKQAGVVLPESPAEQRRLTDGGRDALLAKYVAKFHDRPPAFWATPITPEVAQERLISDLDQALFEIAADPEGAWQRLRDQGLDRELVTMLRDRYGFAASARAPSAWLPDLVATIALTETFLGYGEPADFPLAARLPPVPLRANHRTLVHRWLRDIEFRPAWDRWIAVVEADVDLTAWAQGRTGRSVAFPHLVWHRWRRTWDGFEAAAAKESTTDAFFAQHRAAIVEQVEFLKATNQSLGAWPLLRDLDGLVTACGSARRAVDAAADARALVALYVGHAGSIDGVHLELRHAAEEAGLPAVARVADRSYAGYTNALNEALFARIATAASLEGLGLPGITAHLEHALWKAPGRRAVVIVDALRYDGALAIRDLLRGPDVAVTPVLATLPTVTAIGMTALLPLSGATVSFELKHNALHPRVNGQDMAARANRLDYLRAFGADCRDIVDVEQASEVTSLGELLVVFGHEEVDAIGHGQAETLIRHLHLEIERLARLVRKLHRGGYGDVHIVTDHGFILLDEDKLPSVVPCDKAWARVRKERFALVAAEADLPLVTLPFAWDATLRVAVPPGLAFFQAEKSFSHGGAAVQELVIPHLVSRAHAAAGRRIAVEVVVTGGALQRPAVKVVLRPAPGSAQMALFTASGRTLALTVLRRGTDGTATSVLAGPPKEVRLEPAEQERGVTLFFHTALSFPKGERLELDVRDVETTEQFPPGGLTLVVGRDL